jgi:hypothetical protein
MLKTCTLNQNPDVMRSYTVYYKKLCNQINRTRKSFKTQYYLDQTQHLKIAKPIDIDGNILNYFLAV